MDKDHLIELISNSLLYESKNSDSTKNLSDFKNYLERLKRIEQDIRNYSYLRWVKDLEFKTLIF